MTLRLPSALMLPTLVLLALSTACQSGAATATKGKPLCEVLEKFNPVWLDPKATSLTRSDDGDRGCHFYGRSGQAALVTRLEGQVPTKQLVANLVEVGGYTQSNLGPARVLSDPRTGDAYLLMPTDELFVVDVNHPGTLNKNRAAEARLRSDLVDFLTAD